MKTIDEFESRFVRRSLLVLMLTVAAPILIGVTLVDFIIESCRGLREAYRYVVEENKRNYSGAHKAFVKTWIK